MKGKMMMFTCSLCKASFSFKQSLAAHQRKAHTASDMEQTLVLHILDMVAEQDPEQGINTALFTHVLQSGKENALFLFITYIMGP